MKNFTRFLALTLALLFAVGTISIAATQFPDVDESNPYAKEIDVVSSLGIVTGAKGMFNDGKTARWQFTVYAAKALTGVTSDDVWTKNENTTTFEDLASRTAPAAVSWAVSNDLIKGRSSTEFDPYTTITLAEASAIMVRALGYDYDVRYNAEQPNAWKWAYLTKAMELGITKNLEADALSPDHEVTKSESALLIYNTLFITRKNGSTISDKVWGGVDVSADATAQQFIITAVKTGNGTDQLANVYALHNYSGVKLNGFKDGKVDEDITLYLTSDEFKALTGTDAETVRKNGYVGASLDALYAADGQEIVELSLNTPTVYSGLVAGNEFDTSAKTLTVKGVTFDSAETDFYVAKTSEKGYPALRDPAVYKMSTKGQTVYGVDGEEVVDFVGNKFFLDIDDNIVAENVHDVNSVAYIGVIVSGQYGKFASSAEIWGGDSSWSADEWDDGNYRVATDADLAKVALVDTIYQTSVKANESTFAQAQKEIAYGKYTVTAFDDDGDGEADRIFINGSAYTEVIARIGKNEAGNGVIEYLTYGENGTADADTRPTWTTLLERANTGDTDTKKDTFTNEQGITVNGTAYTTYGAFNKLSDNDYFIAMKPDEFGNKARLEFVEWIPYQYGQIVNLAEIVNPSADYTSTAVIGIADKTTGEATNYYVDINPTPAALRADNAVRVNKWKYIYDYDSSNNKTGYPLPTNHEVYVGVAEDVAYLAVDTVEGKTLKDRSTVVSQWVKFIHLPVKQISGASKVNNVYQVTSTTDRDMILYIDKYITSGYTNAIYVSSNVSNVDAASFTFYDTATGNRVTLDNVSLYDTIFNDTDMAWLLGLKSNLAITASATKNFNYVSNPETASVAAYKNLSQLWADRKTHENDTSTFAATTDTAIDTEKTYYTRNTKGSLDDTEITAEAALDAIFVNGGLPVYMLTDGVYNKVERANAAVGTYYTFTVVATPALADIATYYEKTESSETVVDRYENLLYLNFVKDAVGDFYTVSNGTALKTWQTTSLTSTITEYEILKDFFYVDNTEADRDANPFYFEKDKTYAADKVDGVVYTTGKKFYTNWDASNGYTFDNEKAKFTTAYNTVTEFDVYKVSESKQIGDYLFSVGIDYTVSKDVLVYKYTASTSVPFTMALYDSLTKDQKAMLTKTDNSFERYAFVGADATNTAAAVTTLTKVVGPTTSNGVTTKYTYALSKNAAAPLVITKEVTEAGVTTTTTYTYTVADATTNYVAATVTAGDDIPANTYYTLNATNNEYELTTDTTFQDGTTYYTAVAVPTTLTVSDGTTDKTYALDEAIYKIDSENNLYLYTPAVWGAEGRVTEAAKLTLIAKLTATEVSYFAKSVAGYKALETFVSVGTEGNWNLKDYIEHADGSHVNLKKGDKIALFDATTGDALFTPAAADVISQTGYPELDKAFSAIAASKYGEDAGASGVVVEATEVTSTVKDKDNKDKTVYRYAYAVKGDKAANLSFVKASGTNYNGTAFSGMMLLDGVTVGTVSDNTKFVVISAQDVKVADDGSAYTQLDGFTFDSYSFDAIQKLKIAAYQYIGNFKDSKGNGQSATYVFIFGNVIPGDTGTVTLTELSNATVTGLELNVTKTLPVDTYTFSVVAEEGYPNLSVKINGVAQTLTEEGEFSLKVEKDKTYTITINATATPVDQGTVAVVATDATVTLGDVEISGVKNLDVGTYTFKVTPEDGKPMISVRVNNSAVTLDADNTFTIEVEKDQIYIIEVTCSDAIYVFIKANFNSTVAKDEEGNNIFTWTTGDSAAVDVFTGEKLNGAVYESYKWDDTGYSRIYTGPGIYTVKAENAQFGTGKYQLLRVEDDEDPYYPKTDNGDIFDFLQTTSKLKTGAFYGTEASGTILFFDLGVTDYDLTAREYQGQVSFDRRESKQLSDFTFISFTTGDGFYTVQPSGTGNNAPNVTDPTSSHFLPWSMTSTSYATKYWNTNNNGGNGAAWNTAYLAANNIDELDTILFRYTEGADGKIIVFVNTATGATVKSAKASS